MSKPRIERFKQALKNSVIEFEYKKKSNGKIRHAVGTLDKRVVPDSIRNWKRKTKRRVPMNSVVYYDMESQDIRSFKDFLFQKVSKRKRFSDYMKDKKKRDDKNDNSNSKQDKNDNS